MYRVGIGQRVQFSFGGVIPDFKGYDRLWCEMRDVLIFRVNAVSNNALGGIAGDDMMAGA